MPSIDRIRFVVDENLLRFGKAIAHLRDDLACVGQPPVVDVLPPGIGDTEWIPIVGARGWIMVTNDKRIRTRPAEASLALASGLKVIHLHGAAGYKTAWEQASRFMTKWPLIDAHIGFAPDGPWWLSVQQSKVAAMTYEPGVPERA